MSHYAPARGNVRHYPGQSETIAFWCTYYQIRSWEIRINNYFNECYQLYISIILFIVRNWTWNHGAYWDTYGAYLDVHTVFAWLLCPGIGVPLCPSAVSDKLFSLIQNLLGIKVIFVNICILQLSVFIKWTVLFQCNRYCWHLEKIIAL